MTAPRATRGSSPGAVEDASGGPPRSSHLPGFAALLERYHRSCDALPGLPNAPEVHHDVLYLPASRWRGETFYRGALLDEEGDPIEAGDLVREHRAFNSAEPEPERERVAGTGIYLGWLFHEYGHALLESLARCWALGGADFAVFHAPQRPEVPEFLAPHLERLGVPVVRIPAVPTRFERLIVPRAAFELKTRAYRGFLDAFPAGTAADHRPVYLSRSRLPPHRRAIAGERLLEDQLEGWRIVHPQALSVPEQIDVFSKHRTFAGMIGSGLHGILFSRSPRVTYLSDSEPNLNYLQIDDLVEADSHYVGCCDLGGLPDLGRRMPLRLDLARAAEALGIAPDPGLQPDVDRLHREMWAEMRLKEGIAQGDREALDDVGRHLGGPMTERLRELAAKFQARVLGAGGARGHPGRASRLRRLRRSSR